MNIGNDVRYGLVAGARTQSGQRLRHALTIPQSLALTPCAALSTSQEK